MNENFYKAVRAIHGKCVDGLSNKLVVSCMALLMGAASVSAQVETKGKVIDKYGNPISGAKVEGVGTSVSTTTELDGSFVLETPITIKKVKASASGMTSKKAKALSTGTMVKLKKETIWNAESEGFWFANLQVGIPHYNATSLGLMGGYVKKFGFYVRGMVSFGKKTVGGWDGYGKSSFTGTQITHNYKESFNSITAGVMYHLCSPLYVYAGGGYHFKKMAVQSASEQNTWFDSLYNINDYDYHYGHYEPAYGEGSGVIVDLGIMFTYKKFNINAGLSGYTNEFFGGNFMINGHVGFGYCF